MTMTMRQERSFTAPSPADERATEAFEAQSGSTGETVTIEMPAFTEMSPEDLRQHFADSPASDKGIGSVLDAIARDYDARGRSAYMPYEEAIVALARSEAVRHYERAAMLGVDLSDGDEPLGKLDALRTMIESGNLAVPVSDDEKAATLSMIDAYARRHEDDEHDLIPQSLAMMLYDKAKENRATYDLDSTVAPGSFNHDVDALARQVKESTFAFADGHEYYRHATPIIRTLVGNMPAGQPAPAAQPAPDALAAATDELGLYYAKRDQRTVFDRSRFTSEGDDLKQDYRDAQFQQFLLENEAFLQDPNTTPAQRLEALNRYTFAAGRAIEDAKLEKDGRNRFKKIIHWIGKKMLKHPKLAIAGSMALTTGVGLLTGGALAGATTAALLYTRQETKRYETRQDRKRGFADVASHYDDFYADEYSEALQANYTNDALNDLFDKRMEANEALLDKQITREQLRRLGRSAVSLAAGGAVWMTAHGVLDREHFRLGFGTDINVEATDPPAPEPNEAPSVSPDTAPGATPDAQPNPANVPAGADVPASANDYAPDTFTVHYGQGFFDILNNMNVDPSQRSDVLARAANELYQNGYAYRMLDGMPGIPGAGDLPQGAIDILIKAAAK